MVYGDKRNNEIDANNFAYIINTYMLHMRCKDSFSRD